jgi:hypothetical protein
VALARADTAIAVALDHLRDHPQALVVTTADSDARGMQVVPVRDPAAAQLPLPLITANGGAQDGPEGAGSKPFAAHPDRWGVRLRFGIAWADYEDLLGGIIARAHGLNAHRLPLNTDNTDIYPLLYGTLFGVELPREGPSEP